MAKDPEKVKQGKKNRRIGGDTERRTRKLLEEEGWFVSKFQNKIDIKKEEMVAAKQGRFRMTSTGFPDFICWKREYKTYLQEEVLEMIGVECKSDGILDKTEKAQCEWLLENRVFDKILITKRDKIKNKIVISFKDFENYDGRIKQENVLDRLNKDLLCYNAQIIEHDTHLELIVSANGGKHKAQLPKDILERYYSYTINKLIREIKMITVKSAYD